MRRCWISLVSSVGPRSERDAPRQLLSSALVDMAELNLERGEPLPQANAAATDPDSDLEEPIYLLLQAASLGESREFPFGVDDTGSDSDLLDRDLGVGPVK